MTTALAPHWPRLVAPIAILWYAFGLYQCWSAFHAAGATMPQWVWFAFALASLAGLIGSIALFTHNRLATAAFSLSLISALTYYIWLYTKGQPTGEDTPIAIMVLLVTTALLFLSKRRFT